MKPLLLAVALMGAPFSGLTINAKAGGALGGVIGSHRLVENYQSQGEEIPQKTSKAVSLPSAHRNVVI